jgi:hypothetical protein
VAKNIPGPMRITFSGRFAPLAAEKRRKYASPLLGLSRTETGTFMKVNLYAHQPSGPLRIDSAEG